jgi:hypothetical protein
MPPGSLAAIMAQQQQEQRAPPAPPPPPQQAGAPRSFAAAVGSDGLPQPPQPHQRQQQHQQGGRPQQQQLHQSAYGGGYKGRRHKDGKYMSADEIEQILRIQYMATHSGEAVVLWGRRCLLRLEDPRAHGHPLSWGFCGVSCFEFPAHCHAHRCLQGFVLVGGRGA